jgi:hypothetical protein
MAEIFLEPNVSSLQVGQDSQVELLYSLDAELANADQSDLGTTRIGVSILFNENELDLATDVIAVENGSIADISSIDDGTDDPNVDDNAETTERIFVQVENLPIGFSETRPLLTIPVNETDQFDGSVINFTVPNNPIDTSFPNESSVQLNQEGDDGEPTEPTVELSINPTTGSEEDTTQFTLTATASAAVSGEQTVDLALGADAEAADFGGNVPPQITIADGQTTGTVDVTVNDDDVEEGEETATFTISNPSDGIALGDPVEASATIADNDAVEPTEPTVELSVDPTEGSEEGETVFTLTAEASEAVTGEQTVDLALSGDADADDFVGDLPAAITIADGQTTGTVDVTVNDDDVEEGEETANFALESPPEGFVLGANTNVDITIEDNDAADTPPAEDLQGDFNDDGITNLNDLGLFAAAFGSSEGDPNFDSIFDLGGDEGLINNDDLSQLGTIFAEEFVA